MLSNDWVIRYDTRYFQVARQSHQAPARSTVLVRENADGAIELRYRATPDAVDRDSGAAARIAAPRRPSGPRIGPRPRSRRGRARDHPWQSRLRRAPARGPSRRGARP